MSYNAYIVKIKILKPHSNADRLQVATVFGNDVIVGLDVKENDLMIYFPTDGRLNVEYCRENKLLRVKDEQGNNIGGYMDESKCHVTTIKLRKEKSDGLLMPIKSLEKFTDINTLKEGDTISILNGVLICEKYIPKGNNRNRSEGTPKEKKKKKIETISYPFFEEHRDTSQLAYNTGQFKEGDLCYITLKLHGTSGRSSHTVKEKKKLLPYWLYKILQKVNIKISNKKSWDYISGTRTAILKNYNNGFYGNDNFRKEWHDFFIDKLHKGETIYYEIVGYVNENTTIMPECNNKKTKDKEFIKLYGETTRFTYGCGVGQNDIYVYRMTKTDEDGRVVEYSTKYTQIRCEQMGVKFVPVFDKFIFTTVNDLIERVNRYVDDTDPIGKNHIREGIVVRIEDRGKFTALKHKSFMFKLLEGIIKADDVIDMEEDEARNDE